MQTLKLKKKKTSISLRGVNGIRDNAQSFVTLTIKLDDPEVPELTMPALVVKNVANINPCPPGKIAMLDTKDLKLADPHYLKASVIPVLLGMNVLHKIFLGGLQRQGNLLLQNTRFGWIISGPLSGQMSKT